MTPETSNNAFSQDAIDRICQDQLFLMTYRTYFNHSSKTEVPIQGPDKKDCNSLEKAKSGNKSSIISEKVAVLIV